MTFRAFFFPSIFVKNAIWILIEIALTLYSTPQFFSLHLPGAIFLTGTTLSSHLRESALIQKCILACILAFISVVSKNDSHVWLFVLP